MSSAHWQQLYIDYHYGPPYIRRKEREWKESAWKLKRKREGLKKKGCKRQLQFYDVIGPKVTLLNFQLQEEEELRRQEREAKLFADLGSQGVPTFGLQVCTSQLAAEVQVIIFVSCGPLQEGDVLREGFLQRKNELDEGGRKAASRSWKNHYTVLIGPLLNFYKDKRDFQQVHNRVRPFCQN